MGNKHIYFNKSLNPGKLDDLEGIEHEDNEYSEHWEGTLVESGVGTESVVNKLKDKSSWCWYYDLKSAFHHISIIQKRRVQGCHWRGSQGLQVCGHAIWV